jgi:aspartate/methionine/tyrosine aminotransferase
MPDRRQSAWGLPELRAVVADRMHQEYGMTVQATDEVVITHGASGAFATILDTLLNPGQRVVLFDPTSPLFGLMLQQRRARIRWVPTWFDAGRTRFHHEPFVQAMRGARMIVFADPANPTGATMAPEDLEQIAWWANRFDVLIVLDDTFVRFRQDRTTTSIASFPNALPRTLTIGGVSKSYGQAGLRVGWITGHRHLVRPCVMTQALTAPFVSPLCQNLALTAMRQPDEAFHSARAQLVANRGYAIDRLQGLGFNPVWPSGGFYLWLPTDILGLTGRQFADNLLHHKQVIVTPGDLFGPSGTCFVRLSYAVDEGRLREGLARLADLVSEWRPPFAAPAEPPVDNPPMYQAA